jgi:predicted alpha-1,6-mannanase (GH76 family)
MPNDRRRHQRAQKKRARRAHRKEKQRPSGGASTLLAPGEFWSEMPLALAPKISETLIDFAEPLLEKLPDDAGLKSYQGAFAPASAIWNALAAEEDGPADGARRLDAIKHAMAPELAESAFDDLVNTLRWRKAMHFPGDRRLVLRVDVENRGDRMKVTARTAFKVP